MSSDEEKMMRLASGVIISSGILLAVAVCVYVVTAMG